MEGREGHGVVSMFLHQLSYLGTSCGPGPRWDGTVRVRLRASAMHPRVWRVRAG